MFGFLNPRPHSDGYRRSYARLCLHQRRCYGVASLPFHSFEAVFLYQLAADAGAVPAGTCAAVRCCKLSRRENVGRAADAALGRYCASFAVLLASVKLNDDVRDARSWLARGVRFLLKGRIAQARRYFDALDGGLLSEVEALIRRHHAMERDGEVVPLGRYVEPTAAAFGRLFGPAAVVAGIPQRAALFTEIGRHVGAALLAFDAAVDWERDRARGEFNPLPDETSVGHALAFAADELDAAATACRWHFGPRSVAAATAARVAERVRARGESTCPAAPPGLRQLWRLAKATAFGAATGQLSFAGVMAVETEGTYGVDPPPDRPWKKRDATANPDEIIAEEKAKKEGKTGPCDNCCGSNSCGGACEGGAAVFNCCECLACLAC